MNGLILNIQENVLELVEAIAQFIECLPGMHKGLGSIPSTE